ncbi:MAG: hypothetical protein NT075_14170, partial [Chloroflexi bacterium]|nr:hypothetical protein [Chloroflexota bacterium]
MKVMQTLKMSRGSWVASGFALLVMLTLSLSNCTAVDPNQLAGASASHRIEGTIFLPIINNGQQTITNTATTNTISNTTDLTNTIAYSSEPIPG